MSSMCHSYLFMEKGMTFPLNQFEFTNAFVPSLVEIDPVILDGFFFNFTSAFTLFHYYLSGRVVTIHLNKLK